MITLDIETIPAVEITDPIRSLAARREQDPETFCCLFPPMARVVAVAMHNDKTNGLRVYFDHSLIERPECLSVDACGCFDEPALLLEVFAVLEGCSELLTFNGRGYDIPCLIHRAKIHKLSVPALLLRSARQKPWEKRPHIDLMLELGFGGAMQKYPLQAYCIAYGLEDPKANSDGSHVSELVRENRGKELIEYVAGDVRQTRQLYGRFFA